MFGGEHPRKLDNSLLINLKCSNETNNQDFTGQDLAYKIQERLVIFTGIVSFIVGFYHQKFYYTVLTTLIGLAITILVSLKLQEEMKNNPE